MGKGQDKGTCLVFHQELHFLIYEDFPCPSNSITRSTFSSNG